MDSTSCRLCGYNSSDLVDIFGEQGIVADYAGKIGRYLYLMVTPGDDLPKAVCWMCSQQLDSFHRFHEKINEIQQRTLKERYLEFVIEAHHNYDGEEGEIEIFEHTVQEEEERKEMVVPVEADQQEEIEAEGNEYLDEGEDELTIELIPDCDDENSFTVVKTDLTVDQQPEEQQKFPNQSTETSASEMEVFEIRKSTRKKRPVVKVEQNVDEGESDEEEILLKQKTIRKRTRVRRMTEEVPSEVESKSLEVTRRKSPRKSKAQEETTSVSNADQADQGDEDIEGESGDDFPARDSDNEEWPSAETMDKFPTTMLKDGLLTVKGKQLMDMINR